MSKPKEIIEMILSDSREAGTDGAFQARRVLVEHLSSLGYDVDEQPFRFSATSLTVYPLFGAGLGWLMLVQIPLLTVPRAPAWAALAAWVLGMLALGVLLTGIRLGWAPLGGQARDSSNIVATRGPEPPQRWIVAHYDSKAQGMSLAGRLWAMGYSLVVIVVLTTLTIIRLQHPLDVDLVAGAAVLALIACGLASRGGVKGRSPGARDNATGLLAALTIAHEPEDGTAFLFTAAQQFGLVGARIFAQKHGPSLAGVEVINLDTLDDTGRLRVWYHNDSGAGLAKQIIDRLGQGKLDATRRRVPGLTSVDSVPLARSGAAAITVTRFDMSTLRRVHTQRDDATGLAFDTASAVGQALSGSI